MERFNELSYIDWAFYAQYDDIEPSLIVPDTGLNYQTQRKNIVFIIPIILIIISIIGLIYSYKKVNKQ